MAGYMVRLGVSSKLDADELEEKIGVALDESEIPNTVYEVVEDDGETQWALVSRSTK